MYHIGKIGDDMKKLLLLILLLLFPSLSDAQLEVKGSLTITTPFTLIGTPTVGGEFKFREATPNGEDYIGLKAPDNLTGSKTYILPTGGSNGMVWTLTNATTGLTEWVTPTTGGATTFLGLTDTPASYSGQSLKYVRVNAGETALEFATVSGGGGSGFKTVIFTVPGTLASGPNAAPSIIITDSCTILTAYAHVRTFPTGSAINIDIHSSVCTSGSTCTLPTTTILSATFSIDVNDNYKTTTSFISNPMTVSEHTRLDIDIDNVGTTIPGADLTVEIKMECT